MAHAFISTGDALSSACMKLRSEKFALPAPDPPPSEADPVCATPQDHDSTSISPTCLESLDSPLTSPIFKNTSTAIDRSSPALTCLASPTTELGLSAPASPYQLAFADGSLDTSRSETVR